MGPDGALICHAHRLEGLLTITDTVFLHVMPVQSFEQGSGLNPELDPGLAYDNYCKDSRSWQYYGCSSEDYMVSLIDNLLNAMDQSPLIYLFIWGLRCFQHCTGHITTGSLKVRGNQYT